MTSSFNPYHEKCFLLDLSKNKFVDEISLPRRSEVLGIMDIEKEKILAVRHLGSKAKYPGDLYDHLLFYKLNKFHRPTFFSLKRIPKLTLLNQVEFRRINAKNLPDYSHDFPSMDCDNKSLLTLRTDSSDIGCEFFDKKGALKKTEIIPKGFSGRSILDTPLPHVGYIRIESEPFHAVESTIQILDKSFKKIVSCDVPFAGFDRGVGVKVLADSKTFFILFADNVLGVFKFSGQDKLEKEFYGLPQDYRISYVIVDELQAQLVCICHSKDVTVINGFAPLLDFVAIDKTLDEDSGKKLPSPLRGMITGYLGNPSTMKLIG
jgi:hypothetical protein